MGHEKSFNAIVKRLTGQLWPKLFRQIPDVRFFTGSMPIYSQLLPARGSEIEWGCIGPVGTAAV
jgi:hypothetical protein